MWHRPLALFTPAALVAVAALSAQSAPTAQEPAVQARLDSLVIDSRRQRQLDAERSLTNADRLVDGAVLGRGRPARAFDDERVGVRDYLHCRCDRVATHVGWWKYSELHQANVLVEPLGLAHPKIYMGTVVAFRFLRCELVIGL